MELKTVEEIIERYEIRKENILGVLEDIQDKLKYLPEEALKTVAERFGVSESQVYSLATFYKAFSLKPKGRHHICVCTGTACYVRGADRIVDKISGDLKIKPGDTTEDGNFSLEKVNCVGTCALGPVVIIDGKYHGKMSVVKVDKVMKEYE